MPRVDVLLLQLCHTCTVLTVADEHLLLPLLALVVIRTTINMRRFACSTIIRMGETWPPFGLMAELRDHAPVDVHTRLGSAIAKRWNNSILKSQPSPVNKPWMMSIDQTNLFLHYDHRVIAINSSSPADVVMIGVLGAPAACSGLWNIQIYPTVP